MLHTLYIELGFEEVSPVLLQPDCWRALPEHRSLASGSGRGSEGPYALACANKVSASLTSNFPGPSTLRVVTLPSLTSIE